LLKVNQIYCSLKKPFEDEVRVRESESRYGWRSVSQSVLVSSPLLFKNPVRTSKRTPRFTTTKINLLMLFKEIISVYSENHAKPINTKFSINDCQSRWFI
jgi:hypothetical protein